MEIRIEESRKSRESGTELDVVFQWNAAQSTVVTLSRDQVLDLQRKIEGVRNDDLFAGYDEPDDFGMYSTAGDREVENMVGTLAKLLQARKIDEDTARAYLDTKMDAIAGTHDEVWDTDVREAIADELNDLWTEAFGEGLSL